MQDLAPSEFSTSLPEQSGFVVLDFYSKSCPPCHALASVLEELQNELKNISFYKFDVAADDYKLATEHKVTSVPTLMIFAQGKMIDRRTGSSSKSEIKRWIEDKMNKNG